MIKSSLALRFSLFGVLTGLLLGIYEAAFVLLRQRHLHLNDRPAGPWLLLLAPFVDALVYLMLGAVLGSITALFRRKFPASTRYFTILGLAMVAAQVLYRPVRAGLRIGRFPVAANTGIALLGGLVVAVITAQCWPAIRRCFLAPLARFRPVPRASVRPAALVTGIAIVALTVLRMLVPAPGARMQLQAHALNDDRPNIVMLALDTARADHFSTYGYSRPTTPNLDRLAAQGVLFETAVAPAPWTLPSFSSVFTGRLPHQNQANWETPLPKGFLTLASILNARGYQTAGFNANYTTATARSGLPQGFEFYDDDDASLRTDLININAVKAFWWLVYYPFIQPDYFPRRDALTLNQDVFHWIDHRARRPFFLFANYFDAHEPYSEVPEVGSRFGNARRTLAQRIRAEADGLTEEITAPRTAAEQAALVAGYDSGLAFADSQIGDLLLRLASSPEGSNTYIIVFADHGQSFGTHGRYGHGWGLNWELLHVPLILAGPGIPQGRRVKEPVGLEQLFATVLDLSEGGSAAPAPSSLRCTWTRPPGSCDSAPLVVSELVGGYPVVSGQTNSSISVVTPRWHFIRDALGNLQLYDLTQDPEEETNLAASDAHQSDVAELQERMVERIQNSSPPWLGESYLWALGERQYAALARRQLVHEKWPSFTPRPQTPQDNELLHSLPYQ